jgi:hypothetical protein
MTNQERAAHDARFLNKHFWEPLAKEKRIQRMETLLIHTLIGIDMTLNKLSNSEYTERREQLTSVLASFYKREEKLRQLLEDERQH